MLQDVLQRPFFEKPENSGYCPIPGVNNLSFQICRLICLHEIHFTDFIHVCIQWTSRSWITMGCSRADGIICCWWSTFITASIVFQDMRGQDNVRTLPLGLTYSMPLQLTTGHFLPKQSIIFFFGMMWLSMCGGNTTKWFKICLGLWRKHKWHGEKRICVRFYIHLDGGLNFVGCGILLHS